MPSENFQQKIFDILPPSRKEFPEKKEVIKRKLPSFSFLKKLFLFPLFLLFIAGFLVSFIFPKTTLTIWPETQNITLKEKITIDRNFKEYNFSAKTIPGEILKAESSVSEEIEASGSVLKEERAEGQIRVYNTYSTSPQALIANTRFVSAEGKLFRSLERIIIPGGTLKGGKLEPGFLDIKVRADQPGPEYNIGPSTFSIPGFVGTEKYTAFYGKSFQAMKGGFKGKAPQVKKEDLERGERILKEKLIQALDSTLENKLPEGFLLMENASQKEISPPIFPAQVGEEKERFLGQMAGKIETLIFKKSDLEKMAREILLSKTSFDQVLKEETLEIKYLPETINLKEGKMVLDLESSATVFQTFEKEELKRMLAGKSEKEAGEILASLPKIKKFEFEIWPFWLKNIPKDPTKIEIELKVGVDPAPNFPES